MGTGKYKVSANGVTYNEIKSFAPWVLDTQFMLFKRDDGSEVYLKIVDIKYITKD